MTTSAASAESAESPESLDLLFHRSEDIGFCFGRDVAMAVAMWPCGDDESLGIRVHDHESVNPQ